jgi:serine protease Do
MKYFLRLVSATVTVGAAALAPAVFAAEKPNAQVSTFFVDTPAYLANNSSGYLGVGLRDIDRKRAESLKLKETAGAEIVTIDHDAPAGSAGLKVHDVILQMNGQAVAGAEQLRRMLHETPPDRPISLVISRDGQQQTINTTLVDRAKLEQNAASNLMVVPAPGDDGSVIALAPATTTHSGGNSFLGSLPFGLSSFSVGVQLDTMGSQLADFFGVKDGQGLLVKHVAANSDASAAGLKAGDVVTRVDGHTMATLSDWTKTIRASRGKQVQVVIIRNRQQQILNLQAGDSKHKSALQMPDGFPQAFLDGDSQPILAGDVAQLDPSNLIDPQQLSDTLEQSQQIWSTIDAEQLAEQAREAASQLDTRKFQFDADQLQRNAEDLQQEFPPLLKGFDMEKFQQQFKDQSKQWQQQMDQLKKDFQSWQSQEMD